MVGTTINLYFKEEPEAQRGLRHLPTVAEWWGQDPSVSLMMPTSTGDKSLDRILEQRLRPRDKTGAHAIHLISGHSPTKMSLSLPLPEAFEVWGQTVGWTPETSWMPSRLQHGQPSGAQRDIANSPPRQQRAQVESFSTKSLSSRPLGEKRPFAELSLPKAFTTCLIG